VEIGKEGVSCGMGLFESSKKVMDRYREMIAYQPEHFRSIAEPLVDTHGFTIEGEVYKRSQPSDMEEYFQTWIQRKTIWVVKKTPLENPVLLSEQLVPYLEKEMGLMVPFYNFLIDICE
jgi:uncharacterized protein (DUF2461 family)